ncbi:hypothetical protein JOM56_013491 [Amanita muscaria]
MPPKPTPKSKSKKAPTVASASPSIAQMLKQPVDLESLVAEEMKRPDAEFSLKMDASVISVSSSDKETPLAMKPVFKKVKVALPRPGTPEYDNLKPVTLTRTMTKTQKALAAAADIEESPKKLLPRSSPRKKSIQSLAAPQIDDSHVSVKVESPILEDRQKGVKQKKPFIVDDWEVSGDASDPSDAASVGEGTMSDRDELESGTCEEINHDTVSVLEKPRQSKRLESGGTAAKPGTNAEDSENNEDDSSLLAITHSSILYSFRPYDWNSRLFDEFATFQNLSKSFGADVMQSLLAFLKFSCSGHFVNMARSDPSLFTRGSPVKFAGKNTFPVSLMAISVQESFLRSPGLYGNSTTIPVYKVMGHPFPQEWHRDVSLWCSLLKLEDTEVAGPVDFNKALHLVPIFDGRGTAGHAPFLFSDADFEKLPSWPRWKGEGKLPDDSLVVVGYTWTTYLSMSGAQSMSFSSNLLFVILLALGP